MSGGISLLIGRRYRGYFSWSENRVRDLAAAGANPALIELAEKQLLVANWETAWHTPPAGPHGDPSQSGQASPWARALTITAVTQRSRRRRHIGRRTKTLPPTPL